MRICIPSCIPGAPSSLVPDGRSPQHTSICWSKVETSEHSLPNTVQALYSSRSSFQPNRSVSRSRTVKCSESRKTTAVWGNPEITLYKIIGKYASPLPQRRETYNKQTNTVKLQKKNSHEKNTLHMLMHVRKRTRLTVRVPDQTTVTEMRYWEIQPLQYKYSKLTISKKTVLKSNISCNELPIQ